ncbi:MAG: MXAN_6640 family putative metalloprotease [Candidatus Kapaibacteriales bacterium]
MQSYIRFFSIFCVLFSSAIVYYLFPYDADDEEPIKCLTFAVNKSLKNIKNRDRILVEFDSTGRPPTQCVVHSNSGRFAIHYDTIGVNSVPKLDLDKNGIPDFVDSALFYLEFSYKVFIDSLGFKPPPQDSGRGGSDGWDFYLLQLGSGFYYDVAYGFTLIELEVLDSSRKNIFPRYTAFSIIDNDFSPTDSAFFDNGIKRPTFRENGYLGLKITLAHEFHHILQFGYGDPSFPSFNEMTSTYFESRVFPETRDYLQYVKSLFNNFSKYILSENNYVNGYRYAIYLQFLQRRFGDSVITNLWENIGKGLEPFTALNEALKPLNSSVATTLSEFLSWIYYTGSHFRKDLLPNAKEFPNINFLDTFHFTSPSVATSKKLKPFEIRPIEFIFPSFQSGFLDDTLDILLVNIDFESARQRILRSLEYNLIVSDRFFPNSRQLHPSNYFYLCFSDSNLIVDSTFLNYGFQTISISYSFPNPVKTRDDVVYFPVPEKAKIGDIVEIQIFDSNMHEIPIDEKYLSVSLFEKKRVVRIPANFLNKSGIYFYKTLFNNSSLFGKFSVISQ